MERRREHNAMPEGERLFQSLLDAAAIGIAVEDLEGRPLFANPALCSMLGFTEEELCSKHCVEFSPPEDARKDWALFEQLRQGSIDGYHIEKRFFRRDGTLIWGHLHISLMKNRANSFPLVVAMVEDITEKKAAEENLQRSEANLQNLAGHLIQAQEEERQRIGRELHDDIVQRLSLLVIDLENLGYSLAESGQNAQSQLVSELRWKADGLATDIQSLSRHLHSSKLQFLGLQVALRNLCDRVSTQQHTPVTLHTEELPVNLPSDLELCIYRVVQEALNNVVKHSHTPQAVIELTHAEETIVLKVSDFGVGFDPSSAHSGIGLSSMRERLRLFGGQLSVESAPGNGTTIIATVKLEKAKAATVGELR
jgi:PAS domain S-box-containing protein